MCSNLGIWKKVASWKMILTFKIASSHTLTRTHTHLHNDLKFEIKRFALNLSHTHSSRTHTSSLFLWSWLDKSDPQNWKALIFVFPSCQSFSSFFIEIIKPCKLKCINYNKSLNVITICTISWLMKSIILYYVPKRLH